MKILLNTGLIIYLVNFLIGSLLKLRVISISKIIHQVLFISVIVNLFLILIFVKIPLSEKIICALSLGAILMLPFGKKGGVYHIVISSAGLALYIIVFLKN
ncbi:MAG TPA: hypothetical protein PKD83_06820 [Ignavibacteria bacterium]|nr:hypothetical protein [Ignavibacteria bacterium]